MPATLEPPRHLGSPTKPRYANSGPYRRTLAERLSRPIFLVGAILIHLVVFLLVASRVMFQSQPQPKDEPFVVCHLPKKQPVAAARVGAPASVLIQFPHAPASVSTPVVISTGRPSTDVFTPRVPTFSDSPANRIPTDPTATSSDPRASLAAAEAAHFTQVKGTVTKFWNEPIAEIEDSPGDPDRTANIKVYLASYADGDWHCNVTLDAQGRIVAGSLPDMVAKMNQWGHGRTKATLIRTPLAIGDSSFLETMPPFIFFTGHKDFVLTDAEVANLHEYLMRGGAIWGDNALPGYGSRFDVAFLREMKRVVPDKSAQFEPVPMDYPIFTHSHFPMTKLPEGMNFYAEPLQHLDLFGVLAILYSPNDYSDLAFLDILPDDKTMGPTWVYPNGNSPLFTNGQFYFNSNLFFRTSRSIPRSLRSNWGWISSAICWSASTARCC